MLLLLPGHLNIRTRCPFALCVQILAVGGTTGRIVPLFEFRLRFVPPPLLSRSKSTRPSGGSPEEFLLLLSFIYILYNLLVCSDDDLSATTGYMTYKNDASITHGDSWWCSEYAEGN